ncbi:MAG: TolC family protein [Gemmatimonadaceae bacterium]|nr:TolC family protein [Gemmatimonadaceae bacterium]MCC6431440.1 TolC family protein [Gemmatimonadaceae bacterium]
MNTALRHLTTSAALAGGLLSSPLAAQTDAQTTARSARAADTLYLDELQRAAESVDRRAAQVELLSQQAALRLKTIQSERRPTLAAIGTAQYLSDVTSVGAVLPNGAGIPAPYHEQFDSYLTIRQPLMDPTRRERVAVEQASLAESQARVRTALWQQRAVVNEAFFGVLLREAQRASLSAAVEELLARRTVAVTRVSAGAALQSEVSLLDAELMRRRQTMAELDIERAAARGVLAALTGRSIPETSILALRATDGAADSAAERATLPSPTTLDSLRARPEYAQFARTRDAIDARRDAVRAQDKVRVSAFARTGYGRPGLNQLGRGFDSYWNAGVQMEWSPFNWGRTHREQEVQAVQAELVSADESAFTESLRRAAITEYARFSAIARSLADDDTIIALRQQVVRESALRYDAGELTMPEFIARSTELLSATLDRDTRRVRLREARARYLTTIGREVR